MAVGVAGGLGVLGIVMGLLLVPYSTTTSSPPGSITYPVPTPGVPHLPILPLPHWAGVTSWQYHSLGERGGACPERCGKGLVLQAIWGAGLMKVLVEERELVGEESLSGWGEWRLLGLNRSVRLLIVAEPPLPPGHHHSKLSTAPLRGRGEQCRECWWGGPWGEFPGASQVLYPPTGQVWRCRQLLRMRDCCFTYYSTPIFNTTWMGDTHEETDILLGSRQDEDSQRQANFSTRDVQDNTTLITWRVIDMSWPL